MPLWAFFRLKAPKKSRIAAPPMLFPFAISLGLHVDLIDPERVLVNHAIYTDIATLADRASRFFRAPTIAHRNQELYE